MRSNEKERFKRAVQILNAAYDRHKASGSSDVPKWPASLRIKRVEGTASIWEMTWSFSGPDGRATFEFVNVDDEVAIRWRRIGGHAILKSS